MIRIAVVDDHPALRTGLRTVFDEEPGFVFVGGNPGDEESLWPLLKRTAPDVVLLDYHLAHGDGLQLCAQIKRLLLPPRVLVYSAYAGDTLALGARLAGADGLVDKRVGAREMLDAIRRVHRGERLLPDPSPYVLGEAVAQLGADDAPVVGMLLDGASPAEIGEALRVSPTEAQTRIRRILGRLRLEIPSAAS